MEPVLLVGHRVCGSRAARVEEIARKSRADYAAFERTVQALREDVERSHEADEAYRALTTEEPRP